MRFRNWYIVLGSVLTVILLIITDPDAKLVESLSIGAGTVNTLVFLFKGILGSSLLFITRKAMFDYSEGDFGNLGRLSQKTPEGAGLYAIAIAIMTLAFAVVIVGAFGT